MAFAAWLWMIGSLYFGQKLLVFSNQFLKYSNQVAYPVFLMHMSFIVPIGYYAMQWEMPILWKHLLINLLTIAGTITVYELIVKRTEITKRLFGLK